MKYKTKRELNFGFCFFFFSDLGNGCLNTSDAQNLKFPKTQNAIQNQNLSPKPKLGTETRNIKTKKITKKNLINTYAMFELRIFSLLGNALIELF